MPAARVLFVDDEPSIRATLPEVLKKHGYQVGVAATVAEALTKINSEQFDVLISDLNIGHQGDGFAVVSAMRRVQPDCINFILTGYPAFETALEALRSHVDDYLVKPADIQGLVASIETKLKVRQPHQAHPLKRVAAILREHSDAICKHALAIMKSHSELSSVSLTDDQRLKQLPRVLADIAERLESNAEGKIFKSSDAAAEHGRNRRHQGYSVPMMIEDARCLDEAIYAAVQENLLSLDVSHLIGDLWRVHDILQLELKASVAAYLSANAHSRKQPASVGARQARRTSS